jgi:hypothetical protein
MSKESDAVRAENIKLQADPNAARTTKSFGQAVTSWISAVDPATPDPVPIPPAPVGTEGHILFCAIMAGGWLDAGAKDTTQHAAILAAYDRIIGYGSFGAQYVTPWYPRAWDYIDSEAIYPGGDLTYVLKDSTGHPVWMAGYVGLEYAADVRNPGWQQTVVDRCKQAIAQGYKGVFLDDVNLGPGFSSGKDSTGHDIPVTPVGYDNASWRDGFCTMLEKVRAAIPNAEICHNSVWFHSPNHDAADASTQRQARAANVICYERGFVDGGIGTGFGPWSFDRYMTHMDNIHAAGAKVLLLSENATTQQQAMLNLCGALLVSQGGDSHFNKYNQLASAFWPQNRVNLGTAKGKRYQLADGRWRRDFVDTNGVTHLVTVDFAAHTGTIV